MFIHSMDKHNEDNTIINYYSKQSKINEVPQLPMRSLIIGPSVEKTYVLHELITCVYKRLL